MVAEPHEFMKPSGVELSDYGPFAARHGREYTFIHRPGGVPCWLFADGAYIRAGDHWIKPELCEPPEDIELRLKVQLDFYNGRPNADPVQPGAIKRAEDKFHQFKAYCEEMALTIGQAEFDELIKLKLRVRHLRKTYNVLEKEYNAIRTTPDQETIAKKNKEFVEWQMLREAEVARTLGEINI